MTAIYIRFHRWRGCLCLPNAEPDLFHFVFGLGFCTVYVEKKSLLDAYRKLRRTIEDVIPKDDGR